MSSVAYNLSRKLEWMARRVRRIDDAWEIKNWVEAMTAINCLLKEVDTRVYTDDWKPWGVKRDKEKNISSNGLEEGCLKKDGNSRNTIPMEMEGEDEHAKKKKTLQMLMPALRSSTRFKPKISRKLVKSR